MNKVLQRRRGRNAREEMGGAEGLGGPTDTPAQEEAMES